MKKFLNKLEKVTGIDIDGDGKVGDRPLAGHSSQHAYGYAQRFEPQHPQHPQHPQQHQQHQQIQQQHQHQPQQHQQQMQQGYAANAAAAFNQQQRPTQHQPSQSVQLPPGWERKVDPGSGSAFYINHATETTQWEPPMPAADPFKFCPGCGAKVGTCYA